MIHIASQATRTINILKRNQTRDEIVARFKAQMTRLKELLNVLVFFSLLYELSTLNLSF
jgi:hypothetical protein